MDQPGDVNSCAGMPVSVPFTGSPAGTLFIWSNDNTATGLAASGNGNISFTSSAVTATEISNVTVTPAGSGSCPVDPVSFTITVEPEPAVDQPPNLVLCGGATVNVPFMGTNNTDFNWTNSNPNIGLAASGSGDIDFTALNPATVLRICLPDSTPDIYHYQSSGAFDDIAAG